MTQILRLYEHDLPLPSRGSQLSAGLDLRAAENLILKPTERRVVKTGFAIQLEKGQVGMIWPRSGLAVKYGIDVLAGVIDADYRGEVGVVLINHGDDPFEIKRGDRIAQLVVQSCCLNPVHGVNYLSNSERGEQGFGHTGVR